MIENIDSGLFEHNGEVFKCEPRPYKDWAILRMDAGQWRNLVTVCNRRSYQEAIDRFRELVDVGEVLT